MSRADGKIIIDAKTFQELLGKLTQTMVEKVFREGRTHIGGPDFVGGDIAIMLRYSLSIYSLLFYLNADVRRSEDVDWSVRYGVTAMSLVRSLIDCLYNITLILENPVVKAVEYRKSGLRKTLEALNEDQQRYGGDPKWDEYIRQRREAVEQFVRISGFTMAEVMNQPMWQTLGLYINTKGPGGTLTPHQQFLKTFTYTEWRQYSALSHGAYESFIGTMGHLPVGVYYVSDFLPHENRPKVDESYDIFVSKHLGRAATVLLCMVTELQARCRFEGANINERICQVWEALTPLSQAKELYDVRYKHLMDDRGISN